MSVKSRFLAILTVLTLFAVAATAPRGNVQAEEGTAEPVPTFGKTQSATGIADLEISNDNEPASYIIQLADPALASYRGGVAGLAATNPAANGQNKIENNAATAAYLDYLAGVQASFLNGVNASLGRTVEVKFTYRHAFNGLAIIITPAEAGKIAAMDGVQMVTRTTVEEVLTDVGPAWIGAPGIWDGSGAPAGLMTQGEGVVVAILDTGINSLHPSFADIGGDGYDHTNPLGVGNYLGVCDSTNPDYDPAFVCNDKLIGVHDFIDGIGNDPNSPEDGDGHGSHTGSTVAGNVVTATLFAPTAAITDTISGVAPHANIIAYDVCLNGPASAGGGCDGAALLAAVNQVIADDLVLPNGVAVINYSISGGDDPYADPVELAFLAATDAGIFVSASAGNAGPGAGTVAHVSPWVTTIAASTHNRNILNNVINLTSDGPALGDITGVGFTAGYGPAEIVYAGDFPGSGTPNLCGAGAAGSNTSPWPAGTFNGEIVICDRGTYGRVEKGINVLAAGAGGMILADEGSGVVSDAHFLPATHISQADGVTLKAWVAANTNTQGTITGSIMDYDASNGDIMAGFSSRGPVGAFGILKPDVTAPGVSIWAAVNDDGSGPADYGFLSGTSMSSPHNAGAAALMAGLYPTWTPHQIKSALMLTADNVDNFKEDGTTPADPFDLGAGRIQVAVASNTGFVLNETTANFEDADPALNGGQETLLQQLNLASLANSACVGTCSWTRTIQSVLSVSADYTVTATTPAGITITVTPANFTLAAGGTQVLTIEADVSGAATGDWQFASIQFETDATVPALVASGAPMATSVFTSTPALAIPDNVYNGTLGTMACNTIDTSAIPAGDLVTDVSLQLAASHTWVGDMTIKLQSPAGSILGILSRPGVVETADDGNDAAGFGDSSDIAIANPLTYSDVFTDSAELMGNTLASSEIICADDGRCNYAPAPGSVVGHANFAGFDNENASGNWQLCIGDAGIGDLGTLQEWVLTIEHEAPSGGSVAVAPASMPIAVIPSAGNLPSTLEIVTQHISGTVDLTDLIASEITDLTIDVTGLVHADRDIFTLPQDNDNGADFPDIFFDDPATTYFQEITVTAGSHSVIAEVVSSTSPDLDMLLFFDADDDGIPELSDAGDPETNPLTCQSATSGSLEFCEILNPTAGRYFAAVVNFTSSTVGGTDDTDLATAVVPGAVDAGNLDVTGPSVVPGGSPFTLTVSYNDPTMVAVDKLYGAFFVGSDPGNPGNIGTVNVYLTYLGLPVIDVTPTTISRTIQTGTSVTDTITISNNGDGDLLWDTNVAGSSIELIDDGSFEQGRAAGIWTTSNNLTPLLPICTTDCSGGTSFARTGSWWAWFGGSSANQVFTTASQAVVIPPGSAMLEYWILIAPASAGDADMTVSLDGDVLATYSEADANGGYAQVQIDVSAYADGGSHTLLFDYAKTITGANTNVNMFVDDVSVQSIQGGSCNPVSVIPWLSTAPQAGTTAASESTDVIATLNAMALTPGVYTDTLCINSNDPVTPFETVDIMITVEGVPPTINIDPATISNTQTTNTVTTHTVTISNTGDVQLDWDATQSLPEQDIIVNGSFEGGTDWVGAGDNGSPICDPTSCGSALARTGSWWVWFGGWNETNASTATQSVTIPDTGSATLEFWLEINGDPVTDDGLFEVFLDNTSVFSVTLADQPSYATYALVSLDVSAFADGGTYDLVFEGTEIGTTLSGFFLDDVALYVPDNTCQAVTDISWIDLIPNMGSVAAMSSETVELVLDSTGVPVGTYTATICINSNDPATPLVNYPVTMVVEEPVIVTYGVELYAMAMAITDTIGSTVTYTVHITNTGDMTDTFDISATGTWTTTAPATIELGAGEMGWFYVTVEIPADADAGDSDMATVTATSQGDAAATASLMLATTAEAEPVPANPVIYLPLIMKP